MDNQQQNYFQNLLEAAQNELGTLPMMLNNDGNKSVIELLTHPDHRGYTALHYASANGAIDTVRLLLDIYSSLENMSMIVNYREKQELTTALHYAVQNNNFEVTKLLVEKGNANVNTQNVYGKTPLHIAISYACENGQNEDLVLDWVDYLLDVGANPNFSDANGVTPLHIASSTGLYNVIEALHENGASLDMKDGEGESALFYALREEHGNVVGKLIELGANLLPNEDGEMPIDFCRSIGNESMAAILENSQVKESTMEIETPDGKKVSINLSSSLHVSGMLTLFDPEDVS
eukprot:TRINITY_DN7003_c0_g1_i1.p1 TRINITY_DN7003_c0_g1~~TRINITY_DN7003_c0_g1_i1.p1  ORF type:complete len:312 (-),score=66.78 TRINITY_DN7003_c0_g1_i1:56-928(-)